MSNTETLQYLLLAAVNAAEAYTKRRNTIDDAEFRWKSARPDRDLDRQHKQAQIESTRALTTRRQQQVDDDKDPLDEVLKDVPQSERMQARADVTDYIKGGKTYEEALQRAHDDYGGSDKKYPMPESTEDKFGGEPVPPERHLVSAVEKNRMAEKNRRVQAIGALMALQRRGYDPWKQGPAPGAAETGRPVPQGQVPQNGPFAAPGAGTSGFGPDPYRPGQTYGADFGPRRPPGGAAGGMARLTGQVGPQTGGKQITPPRVPTADVAQQNFQAFANAPQGPLANMGDQRRAGEVAQLWTLTMDQNTPFEQQAAAWFKLHDILGVPVPDVFQQYATGMGIPRNVIDAASGPQSVGSGWTKPQGPQQPRR